MTLCSCNWWWGFYLSRIRTRSTPRGFCIYAVYSRVLLPSTIKLSSSYTAYPVLGRVGHIYQAMTVMPWNVVGVR